MKSKKDCKYWIELDKPDGREYEYCKKYKMEVYCCGIKGRCERQED